jgi:5-aminolevulinate synthase
MFDFEQFFDHKLQQLRREQRYRRFRVLERAPGAFPVARWLRADGTDRDVTVWCSNDYLGMSQHPVVIEAATAALSRYGTGAGGTRNISGSHDLIVALERELADLQGQESALIFSSGFVANDTSLATLGRYLPGCTVFSDANNHASMIEGISRGGASCEVFSHNDPVALHALLARSDPTRPRIVAFESLYSMDGDIAPIAELVKVAKHHGALVFVDETHAVGVHGPQGAGLVAQAGLSTQVDILQGGLGKAYGSVGGFVAGNAMLIDFLRSFAPGFIFTTALPPSVAAAALAAIRHLRQSESERRALFARVSAVRSELQRMPFRTLPGQSQILPLIIGDGARCDYLSDCLIERHGVYLQPINFPTVSRGTERFRITPTARHTETMQERLIAALHSELTAGQGVRVA